jgi:aromatic-L-amino-acid decarboxylase
LRPAATDHQVRDAAETGALTPLLGRIGEALDDYLRFERPDALVTADDWRRRLSRPLPERGVGIAAVAEELAATVIPNGSAVPRPGFTGFITTGGVTASTLASTAASVAAPQRYGLNAFNLLEELSLEWLAEMHGIAHLKGVYSSGGSTANLVALGAARQHAFESVGRDPGLEGVDRPTAVFATAEAHHTVQRAAGVLGLGRRAVRLVATDESGRMDVADLRRALARAADEGVLPVAVVATAGTTNTGAVDPLGEIADVAAEHGVWLHVDGAYGLPGVLDERKAHLFRGVERADSVIVDPHKWLGASVGVAATFVRDRELLARGFTQTPADYLEGNVADEDPEPGLGHSMDDFGIPYYDYGVELSAPPRGVVVWALLLEVGVSGLRDRVRRHNDMAARVAAAAREHPNLELLLEPTLSICCFRYVAPGVADLDALNRRLHRRLVRENVNIPSTTRVNGKLAIRPCFIGARTGPAQADSLVEDVLRIGAELTAGQAS